MKQSLSAICALISLAVMPVWAGKRIQMESTDLTKNTVKQREILLDADRMRVNDGDTSVMFLTAGGSRMVMLDKAKNEYREMDQATQDAMAQQLGGIMAQVEGMMKNMTPEQRAMMEQAVKGKMAQAIPAAANPSIMFVARGTATVNGFRCTNYDGMRDGQKASEICAADAGAININPADFQVMEKMAAFMQSMVSATQNSPLASMIPKTSFAQPGIKGFPVQTTTFTNGQAVTREVLKSAFDTKFTDADFSTGSAKKVEMPNLGAIGGRGAAKGK